MFDVSLSAIEKWKRQREDFRNALKVGKAEADNRVERSLYERANGYSYDAVKIFMPAGAKKPVYAPYVEHVPPSDVACIFWLKNRRPDLWRDTHQLEHTLGKYHISDKPMSEEDWIKARAIDVTPKEDEPTSPALPDEPRQLRRNQLVQ